MECKLSSGCENNVFKDLDFCALHCSDEEVEYSYISDYLEDFSNLFMKNLFENIINNRFYKVGKDRKVIPDYELKDFKYSNLMDDDFLIERLGELDIVIKDIRFPKEYSGISLSINYTSLVKKIGRIKFKNCYFYNFSFIGAYNSYYEYCYFNDRLNIHPFPHVVDKEGGDSLVYRYCKCTFFEDVIVCASYTDEMYCNVFDSCNFKKSVLVKNLKFKKNLFRFPNPLLILDTYSATNTTFRPNKKFNKVKSCYKIEKLTIKKCIFEESLKINGFDVDDIAKFKLHGLDFKIEDLVCKDLRILDTKFKSKLEIKNRVVKNFRFENSNVEKVFDSFESKFEKSYFYKSIFTDFAGFEDVQFGSEQEKGNKDFLTIFKYVTFMDFSSFRGAKFSSGLDFSKTNLKDTPNFLDVHISPENTDRETFRIVKNSFDDTGNKIEASRFFVKEMNAYQRELIKTKDKEVRHIKNLKNSGKKNEVKLYKNSKSYKSSKRARWVFNINSFISEFGSNYMRPISILFFLAIIYTSITLWHEWYFKSHEYFMSWKWFDFISKPLNEFAINILPFRIFIKDRSGIEFISLIFYVLFAILIWQIIVAVKRHTQR